MSITYYGYGHTTLDNCFGMDFMPSGDYAFMIAEYSDKSCGLWKNYSGKKHTDKAYDTTFKNLEEAKKYVMNYTEPCKLPQGYTVCDGASNAHTFPFNIPTLNGCVSVNLAEPCAKPEPQYPWGCKPAKKEKEDNLMYNTVKIAPAAYATVSAPESDTQKKIDYLRERARGVKYDLSDALGKQFKLHETPGPKTIEDLTDAIKNGDFTVDEKMVAKDKEYFENYGYHRYDPVSMLKFTNFAGPDKEGYKKASKALADEYQKIKDIIQIKSADEALEAIQAFEKWTYAA